MADKETGNGQRSMYVFFLSTLVGPFFAALLVLLAALAAGLLHLKVADIPVLTGPDAAALIGRFALQTYVWAALPAGLAGALMAAWVSLRSNLPWIAAVGAGIGSFGVASIMMRGLVPALQLPLAFVAGVSALGVWLVLRRAGIITAE